MENQIMNAQLGDVCFGFRLTGKKEVASARATVYTLCHEKTGAQVLYSARQDDNKTFAISFETLPENHTGVFHILEHSVLNGSEKFPVKEPFVNLLQSSMQTFLNAMTFSDKTVYPVSSRNEKDFFNLMQVYLDAVFCPKIYTRPEIFMQEGWHYEMPNPEESPKYNGVVFSEMKGVFSNVDELMEESTMSLVFPDTCYGYVSGGHPAHIPELTYDEFIRTHQRFYHPSNAKIFLDGAMDVDSVLQYIDTEYLSKYEYRQPDFAVEAQAPRKLENTVSYQTTAGEEPFAHLVLARLLCKFDDIEKIYAANILCDYLTGTNEAPLKRAVLESGLAQDVLAQTLDGIYQSFVSIKVRNTKQENFSQLKQLLQDAVEKLIKQGLNREDLAAVLERYAFSCREIQEPRGVHLCIKSLDSWLYGGDPTAYWDTEPVIAALRKKLDEGYFEQLLQEMFGQMQDMSQLSVLPSSTKAEEDGAKEQAALQEKFAQWSKETRQEISQKYLKMAQWQKTPDAPEDVQKLPKLALSDVHLLPRELKTGLQELGQCPVVEVNTDTNGIAYVNLFFRIADMTVSQLQEISVLASLFGELSTEKHTALALQNKVRALFGNLEASVDVISKDGELDSCTPYFTVSASMLEENVSQGMALLQEILLNTQYTEAEKIYETLVQSVYACKQALISSGHSFAITRAGSFFTAEGALRESLEGETFVSWFDSYAKNFDADRTGATQSLAALHKKIFTASRLCVGYGGKVAEDCLSALVAAFPQGETVPKAVRFLVDKKKAKDISITSSVAYSAISHNLYALGQKYSGSALVLSSLMSFGYLWNAVRVQGGAYGTGMAVRPNGDIFCYSYRDPNPQKTVEAYKNMPRFLAGFCKARQPIDDIIIGTVNKTDPLASPSSLCMLGIRRFLKGTTYENICTTRKEILTTTAKDLKNLLKALKKVASKGAVSIVSGK